MGKLVARGLGVDEIATGCGKTTPLGTTSKNVYVEGVLVHVNGNSNTAHLHDTFWAYGLWGCVAFHKTPVIASTTSVFVGDKAVARMGDKYLDHNGHGYVYTNIRISNVTQHSVFAG